MPPLSHLLATTTLAAVLTLSGAWDAGAPCMSQHSMMPSRDEYGPPVGAVEPPYHFSISDKRGNKVKEYVPGEQYTVRLSGTVPFRAFLLQARLATNEGFLIGHLRAGRFVPDELWQGYGLRTLETCLPPQMNALTNVDFKDKFILEAKWMAGGNVGAVQFILTVFQEHSVYWERWTPAAGFLKPAPKKDQLKHAEDKSAGLDGDDGEQTQLFVNQPPPALPQTTEPPPAVTQIVVESERITVGPAAAGGEEAAGDIVTAAQAAVSGEEDGDEKAMETMGDDDTPTMKFRPLRVKPDKATADATLAPIVEATVGDDEDEEEYVNATARPPVRLLGRGLAELTDPDKETVMHAVLDPRTNRVVEFSIALTDNCESSPCYNGGTCSELPEEDSYSCRCPAEYTGDRCQSVNHCHGHECEHGGICKNAADGYTCRCLGQWAGDRCQHKCPRDTCANGGTCVIGAGDRFECRCQPGYTGEHCEQELNECEANPCRNGGVCADKFNGFDCKCTEGFMGGTCHRPCQDIYKSCKRWKRENRCITMRKLTKFFDVNCAVTCDTCAFVNDTVRTYLPLAPVLEPFSFLIGQWRANFTRNLRHPVDFADSSDGYIETVEFAVAEVPMFGTPSVNYTSRAVARNDPEEQLWTYGFLTLNARSPKDRPAEVALLTTSTDGVTLVEEGTLESATTIVLKATYAVRHPEAVGSVYKLQSAERMFVLAGPWLQENVNRQTPDGRKVTYTKYFSRVHRQLPF